MTMKRFRQSLLWLAAVPTVCGLLATSCTKDENIGNGKAKSLVILYDNDVHCGVDGYTKMAGLRDAILAADTAYVAIVSSGDFLQGGTIGAISHGEYIIDIMRAMNYDAVTIGNHEFDYGTPVMERLLNRLNAPVVCANFFHIGEEKAYYAPYVIKTYGYKRVAFVGVCTPESMFSESYSFYNSEGAQLYDLKTDKTYSLVQQAVDKARSEGADYVVLLSHLGETENMTGVNSPGMVKASKGIDVVLDGHSHSVIEHQYETNLDGQQIAITQTGTQFANVGKLLISRDGHISTTLIPAADIPYSNSRVTTVVDSVKAEMNAVASRLLGTSDYDLTINGTDGKRLVRSGETNLGDLVADAFRTMMEAEIGLANGGGIRNSIPAGTITYFNAIDVQPFDNHLCKIEATGQQILDMLQKCTANTPAEDGNFPQVAGMKFTIHTASHTVSDVMVYDAAKGEYLPIDPSRKYTIASSDYVTGGGYYDVLKQCTVLSMSTLLTRDALADYIEKNLNGTTGETYRQPQGRITIVND